MKLFRILLCLLLVCVAGAGIGCRMDRDVTVSAGDDTIFPVSGEILSEAQSAALSTSCRVRLYFITQRGDMISPEMKLISFGEKEKRTQYLATTLVKALITGPSNTRLASTLPSGTTLNSVKLKGNVAVVDFGGEFGAIKSYDKAKSKLIIMSVVNTLTEFKDINAVTILYNGSDISDSLGFDSSNVSRDLSLVTDIENAAAEVEYTENVFLEIELE
ncbi:MAG: GerMN domain-containing protein [Clostridia bacterium]|nr:GerMN domain-containing protein [Clostridia bacterium]